MAAFYRSIVVALALCLLAERNQVEAFEPLVETGVSRLNEAGRHVAVHVPGFFNMMMDTRGPGNGVRMSQSVMSGLVSIFIDREKQGDSITGPVRVKVGGITMYDNGAPDLASSSALNDQDNLGGGLTSRLGAFFGRSSSGSQLQAPAQQQ